MRILFDDQDGEERTRATLGEMNVGTLKIGELVLEQKTLLGGYRKVRLTLEQVAKLVAALDQERKGER